MASQLAVPERRAHPRIAAPLRAYLVKGPIDRAELPVRDISRRGLFLYTPTLPAEVGEPVSVELVNPEGTLSLILEGRIARAVITRERLQGIGVHFVNLTDQQRERLDVLLSRLVVGPGGQRRAHPRIARRVALRCVGADEGHALLRDLSCGGASIWTEVLLKEGDRIHLCFQVSRGDDLELPGRVVFAEPASGAEPFHQVGVQFEDLNQSLRARLEAYLPSLLLG